MDGEPIKPSKKYEITVDGTVHRLVVKDVTDKDEADFTAVARDKSTTAALFVEGRIHFFHLQICSKIKVLQNRTELT